MVEGADVKLLGVGGVLESDDVITFERLVREKIFEVARLKIQPLNCLQVSIKGQQ